MTSSEPVVIGWKEWLMLPEWGIRAVKCKIDTGAKTSALDGVVESVETTANGLVATLRLHFSRRDRKRTRQIRARLVRTVQVRSSTGELHPRHVVETQVRLGFVEQLAQFTVADRSRMLTPIILGRLAIQPHFIVDVSRKFLLRSETQ